MKDEQFTAVQIKAKELEDAIGITIANLVMIFSIINMTDDKNDTFFVK